MNLSDAKTEASMQKTESAAKAPQAKFLKMVDSGLLLYRQRTAINANGIAVRNMRNRLSYIGGNISLAG